MLQTFGFSYSSRKCYGMGLLKAAFLIGMLQCANSAVQDAPALDTQGQILTRTNEEPKERRRLGKRIRDCITCAGHGQCRTDHLYYYKPYAHQEHPYSDCGCEFYGQYEGRWAGGKGAIRGCPADKRCEKCTCKSCKGSGVMGAGWGGRDRPAAYQGYSLYSSTDHPHRRLCEHTSFMGMSYFGGDCDNCKRNAEIRRKAEERAERNEHVTYPKTDDEHNPLLNRGSNRRLATYDCPDCKGTGNDRWGRKCGSCYGVGGIPTASAWTDAKVVEIPMEVLDLLAQFYKDEGRVMEGHELVAASQNVSRVEAAQYLSWYRRMKKRQHRRLGRLSTDRYPDCSDCNGHGQLQTDHPFSNCGCESIDQYDGYNKSDRGCPAEKRCEKCTCETCDGSGVMGPNSRKRRSLCMHNFPFERIDCPPCKKAKEAAAPKPSKAQQNSLAWMLTHGNVRPKICAGTR